MTPARQVICMKWGTRYGAEYVNRLYAMARRHISGPLRFVCLTDDREGVHSEVECHDCPTIDIPPPRNNWGWRKLNLFAPSEQLFGLDGDWLYLDLDVVVTGPLDDFFTYQPDKPFIVMKNLTQRRKWNGVGNTSVYRFRVGADPYLLSDVLTDTARIIGAFNNSQTYISRSIREINFWPDGWCTLFKVDCVPGWPSRFWREPLPPDGSRVVAFPGKPDPHEALEGRWPEKNPFKWTYKFIRPARWIKDAWAGG